MFDPSDSQNAPLATVETHPSPGQSVGEERRATARLSNRIAVRLTGMGCSEARALTAEGLSAGGVFLRVPADYGLTVGQRCEVNFVADPGSQKPTFPAGETCYATVVRTERCRVGADPMVGAGLRFDQPLFF